MTYKTFCDLASSPLPSLSTHPVPVRMASMLFLVQTSCTHSSNPLHCFCLKFSSSSYTMIFLLSPSSGICLTVILSVKTILTFFFLHSIHYYLTCCIFYLYCFLICLLSLGRKFMQGRGFICFVYLFYLLLYAPAPKREPGIQ